MWIAKGGIKKKEKRKDPLCYRCWSRMMIAHFAAASITWLNIPYHPDLIPCYIVTAAVAVYLRADWSCHFIFIFCSNFSFFFKRPVRIHTDTKPSFIRGMSRRKYVPCFVVRSWHGNVTLVCFFRTNLLFAYVLSLYILHYTILN